MTHKTEAEILALLETDLVHAPVDFSQRISAKIQHNASTESADQHIEAAAHNSYSWWQWLAMVGGSVLGMTQVARFIFGYWLSVAAT
jgi:hypothetical protein